MDESSIERDAAAWDELLRKESFRAYTKLIEQFGPQGKQVEKGVTAAVTDPELRIRPYNLSRLKHDFKTLGQDGVVVRTLDALEFVPATPQFKTYHEMMVAYKDRFGVASATRDQPSRTAATRNPSAYRSPPSDPLLVSAKVAAYEWGALSDAQRRLLVNYFETSLFPRAHAGRAPTAPPGEQIRLAQANGAVQHATLLAVLAAFNCSDVVASKQLIDHLRLGAPSPMSPQLHQSLDGLAGTAIPMIADAWSQAAASGGLTDRQRHSLTELHAYLGSSTDVHDAPVPDVVLVTGSRRGIDTKAGHARSIAASCEEWPLMILAGGRPVYSDEEPTYRGDLPILAEAEMLDWYQNRRHDQHRYPAELLVIEVRPRTLYETLQLSLEPIRAHVARLGRPVHLAIITASFQARRAGLLAHEHLVNRWPSIIWSVTTSCPPGDRELRFILRARNTDEIRREVEIYVGEIFKLIGGRASGEF